MTVNRFNLPLLVGLVLSVMFHAMLMLPWLMATITAKASVQDLVARFDPEDVQRIAPPPPPPEEDQTPLGLDADTPSTLTWVGYDEYEEHIAALAEMDQAAFTENPVVSSPPVPMPATPPVEEMVQPQPEEAPSLDVEDTVEPEAVVPIPLDPEDLQTLRNVMDALGQVMASPTPAEDVVSETPAVNPTPEIAKAEPTETPPEKPSEQEVKPAEAPKPTPQPQPDPATTPTENPPEEGDPSDRESDATSVIEALPEHWKAGKPLASPGLEIRTRKPAMTVLQRLMIAGRNPLCKIKFGRNGKPSDVLIVETSGSREFDSVITSTLYRWRARGKKLETLKGEETADVVIRIVLRAK